jgi:NTP pyrophosphatase (non-canonical NTP hydrolase)
MDIKLRKDFLAEVEAAVVSAERKHPKVCDVFVDNTIGLLESSLELVQCDNDYLEETGKSMFFEVIREELLEAAIAFKKNKYNDCIKELAQVATVAVRGMEFVYKLTPEAKASEKFKVGEND